jgi:hypothetical protein
MRITLGARAMTKNRFAWWLWAVATTLILLSWIGAVPLVIGWVAFGLGILASIMSWGLRPPRKPPRDEPS